MGTQLPSPKRGQRAPNFRSMSIFWPNVRMDRGICHLVYGGRPRPRPHCARWGPSSPSQKGHSPQFSAHVCCGQTAGRWMDQHATWYDIWYLGPGNGVLDADPAPPEGAQPPNFGPCLLWPNGWMDQDATWYVVRTCVGLGQAALCYMGTQLPSPKGPPNFWPMSIVAKRSPSELLQC